MTRPQTEADRAREFAKMVADQQLEDDMRWLMGDGRGRRLVWRWLGDGGIFRPSFTGDALQTAFREGERNRALALLADVMQCCPEQWIRMQAEAQVPDGAHTGGAAPQSAAP